MRETSIIQKCIWADMCGCVRRACDGRKLRCGWARGGSHAYGPWCEGTSGCYEGVMIGATVERHGDSESAYHGLP